jgi:hypothetical protein
VARERTPVPRKIVCVTTDDHPHRHIVSAGVNGDPQAPFDKLTVDEVREQLGAEPIQPFCTRDAEHNEWLVRKAICHEDGCRVKTIESVSDTPLGSRLSDLEACTHPVEGG